MSKQKNVLKSIPYKFKFIKLLNLYLCNTLNNLRLFNGYFSCNCS